MKIPAIQQLFLHTQSYVTPAMIAVECPNDPGYWRYVERWNEILRAKEPPTEWDFAVSETIGLTRWGDDYNPGLCRSFTGTVDCTSFWGRK
jgi:hypothetical protein